jgi:hypothetical protein
MVTRRKKVSKSTIDVEPVVYSDSEVQALGASGINLVQNPGSPLDIDMTSRVFFITKNTSCGEVEALALSLDELELLNKNSQLAIEYYKKSFAEGQMVFQKISV